ncbi:putative U3 small nucleolar RNA-associated protein 18 [Golovinomyces cichoracearum]|uniref:Putative U3 small nucleolar RNA-associated protein 18 n=1 Tax=Golovinomyces cichoracearum TaxID=62708 RepID=A0A420HPG6_9PEZI|nr:putative U3 small nucleolar RNA-associated protein 18 [Golovinomyces cichoracearum]
MAQNSNDSLQSEPKGEDEERLEELVFGNGFDFTTKLKSGEGAIGEGSSHEKVLESENQDSTELANLDDAEASYIQLTFVIQLFFLDSGPSRNEQKVQAGNSATHLSSLQSTLYDAIDEPAWIDSDDERLVISLATNSRLKKLRLNEDEDIINGQEYIRRLQRQYERLNPVPPWAQEPHRAFKRRRRSSTMTDSSASSSEDDDPQSSVQPIANILQKAGSLTILPTSTKRPKLRPEVLDIQQTRPIPSTQSSAVLSLSFHPKYPMLLSSGLASTLFLHHIDPIAHPTPNPLITSVYVKRTPLFTSSFLLPKGEKIIFSGRRKYFHIWDLESGNIEKVTRVYGQKEEQKSMEVIKPSPCGRYLALQATTKKGGGIINILDANTTQWIASMRIEGAQGVADFAWWRSGEGLTVVSKTGEVGEWSVGERAYVARWIDDGFAPTVLTLGGPSGPKVLGGDRWVIIGSQSGIINIYDRRNFVDSSDSNTISIPERPQPKKSFDQLTKPISHLVISPDGQLLSFSSKWKRDALRLVHLPSCVVYRNWPTDRTPLGRITAVAFSNESDSLAVGNDMGKIHMWEIRG